MPDLSVHITQDISFLGSEVSAEHNFVFEPKAYPEKFCISFKIQIVSIMDIFFSLRGTYVLFGTAEEHVQLCGCGAS